MEADGLARAPTNVRKAADWLAANEALVTSHRWGSRVMLGLLYAGFPLAGIVATAANSEPIGAAVLFGTWAAAAGVAAWNWRSWQRLGAANDLIQRWKRIEELGLPPDLAPPEPDPATDALQRMVSRIEALAGPDREPLRQAAASALERARRIRTELHHLGSIATGQPDADAALDAARERLEAELATTRARVAELYASLVELETAPASDELQQALKRVSAELEVDQQADAARRARAAASRSATRG
jgi:hypothetical protein